MSRKSKAVLCRELNKPVVVEEISVEPPRRGEVTIRLGACGVCHSDLSATNGTIPMPPPLVLGHEGAGEVIEVGEDVSGFAVGDHVISSFIYMCGKCRFCSSGRPVLCIEQGKALTTLPDGTVRTHDARGNPVNVFSGCGVMAEYATVHVDNLVKIDPKIPLDRAALVGCGVTTGVGAVFNTAKVAAAYRAIRRGGLAVVVGVAKPNDSTSVRTMSLPFEEKTLTGSYFGSCVPRVDFPRMLALYMGGKLKLDELITRRYSIAEAPQAFADLESGRNARGVIVFQ
jgi:Zn-dependent alcohol dehydrogenase